MIWHLCKLKIRGMQFFPNNKNNKKLFFCLTNYSSVGSYNIPLISFNLIIKSNMNSKVDNKLFWEKIVLILK